MCAGAGGAEKRVGRDDDDVWSNEFAGFSAGGDHAQTQTPTHPPHSRTTHAPPHRTMFLRSTLRHIATKQHPPSQSQSSSLQQHIFLYLQNNPSSSSSSSRTSTSTGTTKRHYARQTRESFITSYVTPDAQNPHTTFPVAAVFGCTGFIGKYIVQELAYNGYQVITPYRGSEFKVNVLRPMGDVGQIVHMRIALDKPETIADVCSRSNVVVNCIGRHHDRKFDDDWETVNVKIPSMVAKACADTGVDRLIHVSHIGAQHPDHPSELVRMKHRAEQNVRALMPQSTIVRPTQVYGQYDRFTNAIARRLQPRYLLGAPVVNHGVNRVQPVFVGNVADAVLQILQRGKHTEDTVYELGGPRIYTYNEVVKFIADHMPAQFNTASMPLPVARLAGRLNELKSYRPHYTADWAVMNAFDALVDTAEQEAPQAQAQGEEDGAAGAGAPRVGTFADLGIDPVAMEDMMPHLLRRWNKSVSFLIKDTYHNYSTSTTSTSKTNITPTKTAH